MAIAWTDRVMSQTFVWITVFVLVGWNGSLAYAELNKTPIEKIKALLEEEFLPQMYAQVAVNNGNCIARQSFDVQGNSFNTSKGYAKKIKAQLDLNMANAWTVIDLIEDSFNTISEIRVVPLLCTDLDSEEDTAEGDEETPESTEDSKT